MADGAIFVLRTLYLIAATTQRSRGDDEMDISQRTFGVYQRD
jgi:hypothetical protein